MRNTIQKAKIDMANEVIDAGRFDMQTTMEERKITLESLLQVGLALFLFCHLEPLQLHLIAPQSMLRSLATLLLLTGHAGWP